MRVRRGWSSLDLPGGCLPDVVVYTLVVFKVHWPDPLFIHNLDRRISR